METLKIFFRLFVLKACPGDLEPSYGLLGILVFLNFLLELVGLKVFWLMLLTVLVWKLFFIFFLLKFNKLDTRFIQTGTALWGMFFIFSVIKFACFHLPFSMPILNIILTAMALWQLVVTSFILQRALSTHIGWAILATIGFFLSSGLVMLLFL